MPVGIKYNPSISLDIYRLALTGLSRSGIARAVGTDKRTFKKWMVRHPEVKKALDMGYGRDSSKPFVGGKQTFIEYGLTCLPPKLHDLWKQLNDIDDEQGTEKRFDMLMADKGKAVKQQIFLHSLISTNFNKFKAMRRACVNHYQVDKWRREDPDFADLVNHVHEMKKDFIEGCLMGLIGGGDSAATIFASKTLLQDRGYGAKVTIKHEGGTTNKQLMLKKVIYQLGPKAKRQLLDKIRETEAKALPPRRVQTEEVP